MSKLQSYVSSERDRRQHQRVVPRKNQPIPVQLLGDGFVEMLWAQDLSVGGLAVSITHDVDPSAFKNEVHIILTIPGASAFSAYGTVRHISVERKMFGVQFTKLKPQHLAIIEAYVAARVTEGGGA